MQTYENKKWLLWLGHARKRIKLLVSQVTAKTDHWMVVPRHSSILTDVKSSSYLFSWQLRVFSRTKRWARSGVSTKFSTSYILFKFPKICDDILCKLLKKLSKKCSYFLPWFSTINVFVKWEKPTSKRLRGTKRPLRRLVISERYQIYPFGAVCTV
jgi:hypothetical protein